ncbi:PREDICTED: cysteine dioxygenase type 1-like, partial [Priapulus caudatus]|uniref:Cysteine dioxygenase n=1 Tax=Priapulus caudatus TaxID=37621 RepID=A0ABM1FAD7_PRICU
MAKTQECKLDSSFRQRLNDTLKHKNSDSNNDSGADTDTASNDSLGLHRIENPSHTDLACSLHLYCPPFDECFTFDERTAHKNTCKTTFHSKFGVRTPF